MAGWPAPSLVKVEPYREVLMAKPSTSHILVVGGGIFGITAALELARRGQSVEIFDPGPLPHVDASSTDISKVIRMDYGADDLYMSLMETAIEGWRAWNSEWERRLFHETGFLLLTRQAMQPGEFEFESYRLLQRRGHRPERITPERLADRFPAWAHGAFVDGYFNPEAGWAESGEVVRRLIEKARQAGVAIRSGSRVASLLTRGERVRGVRTADGEGHEGEAVVVAAGAWTPRLIPWLSDRISAVGQPVLHFRAEPAETFRPPHFVPWAADIAHTGWYGFAALEDGTFKIANHGPGRRMTPEEPRSVDSQAEGTFRAFLRESLPSLAEAPLIGTRLCLYSDTWDGNFYIDRDPERTGLIVASGGSGHGFKFAPVLGGLIADAVEGVHHPALSRFKWRPHGAPDHEEARHIEG
jgi:glycine/D-amino acid oxidase-like deaminating enzyme